MRAALEQQQIDIGHSRQRNKATQKTGRLLGLVGGIGGHPLTGTIRASLERRFSLSSARNLKSAAGEIAVNLLSLVRKSDECQRLGRAEGIPSDIRSMVRQRALDVAIPKMN